MKLRVLENGKVRVNHQQIEVVFDFKNRTYTSDGETNVHFDKKYHSVDFTTMISVMRNHALHFEPKLKIFEALVSYDDGINLFEFERVSLKTKTFEAYVYGKRSKGTFYAKYVFPTDFSEELTEDFVEGEDRELSTFLTKLLLKHFSEKDPKIANEGKIKFASGNLSHAQFQEFVKEMEERYAELHQEIRDSKISVVKYGNLPSEYDEWFKSVDAIVSSKNGFYGEMAGAFEKEHQEHYIEYCKRNNINYVVNENGILVVHIGINSTALKSDAFIIPEKRYVVARYGSSDFLTVREYYNDSEVYNFINGSAGRAFREMYTVKEMSNIETNINELIKYNLD